MNRAHTGYILLSGSIFFIIGMHVIARIQIPIVVATCPEDAFVAMVSINLFKIISPRFLFYGKLITLTSFAHTPELLRNRQVNKFQTAHTAF